MVTVASHHAVGLEVYAIMANVTNALNMASAVKKRLMSGIANNMSIENDFIHDNGEGNVIIKIVLCAII